MNDLNNKYITFLIKRVLGNFSDIRQLIELRIEIGNFVVGGVLFDGL